MPKSYRNRDADIPPRRRGDHYRAWLRTWPAESRKNNRLPFDEADVLAALAEMVEENEGEPVPASKVMDELAPGKWTLSEVARVSQALVRRRAAGKVDRAETTGRKRLDGRMSEGTEPRPTMTAPTCVECGRLCLDRWAP